MHRTSQSNYIHFPIIEHLLSINYKWPFRQFYRPYMRFFLLCPLRHFFPSKRKNPVKPITFQKCEAMIDPLSQRWGQGSTMLPRILPKLGEETIQLQFSLLVEALHLSYWIFMNIWSMPKFNDQAKLQIYLGWLTVSRLVEVGRDTKTHIRLDQRRWQEWLL